MASEFGGLATMPARRRRRSFPIHAYIGANGSGKSYACALDTIPSLVAGRPVVSTMRFLDFENPRPCEGWRIGEGGEMVSCEICAAVSDPTAEVRGHMQAHPLWVPLNDYRTLLDVEHCDVVLDEVTGVASSRESAGMPAAVANLLVQLRRKDVALRWTAPSWKRADTIIREVSQGVTLGRGFASQAVHDETGERLWTSKRLFYWRTYDAAAFDEWSQTKKDKIRPSCRQWFWRPGAVAGDAYDTFDAVLSLGEVTEGGSCMDCGGHRTKKKCACDGHAPSRRSRRVQAVEVESPGEAA